MHRSYGPVNIAHLVTPPQFGNSRKGEQGTLTISHNTYRSTAGGDMPIRDGA